MRFGGWVLYSDGLEFVEHPFHGQGLGYFIPIKELLRGTGSRSWHQHLKEKNWFDVKVEQDFLTAVEELKKRVSV